MTMLTRAVRFGLREQHLRRFGRVRHERAERAAQPVRGARELRVAPAVELVL
jgi:hypothetical protein